MKKAVVVGGSNGIGLAIAKNLIIKGYFVYILDKTEPDKKFLNEDFNFTFLYIDLLDFDAQLFETLKSDTYIDLVMITAGFGRVSKFEYLHISEIENIIKVNTISAIKIINIFYDRIRSNKTFYCGIMGSIAGMISSPLFSVYAASKAAVMRFVESVNIELNAANIKNRILNVSPGHIDGTRFDGGNNNLDKTLELAEQIVQRLFSSEELYIPQYNEIYKDVIERYNHDPLLYGLSSYEYKISSGRVINEKSVCIGYLSGTFDLFHVGHLNLLRRAKQNCDYLIVGVHPDASHKGKRTFIPLEERKKIVASIKYVDQVVNSVPEDCDAWKLWHYNKLFVGSDYIGTERFKRYEEFFSGKEVEIVYFPYTKGTSSTQIREKILMSEKSEENKYTGR